MTPVGHELDLVLREWAGNLKFFVQRKDVDRSIEFSVDLPGTHRRVEIGHANDVHIWLVVDSGWRVDTHGDDLKSLIFDWEQFLEVSRRVLQGTAKPPPVNDSPTRKSWFIPDLDLFLRFRPKR